ncbi:MAG: HlyC/CorC family transporter [Eubacterium sp.]
MRPSDAASFVALLALILLSGFFSSAETALTTLSKVRLRMLVDDNRKNALLLQKIVSDSGKMLSAVLIGNNIVNISASALATITTQNIFGSYAVSIATGILTLLILVFGEIIPKTIATIYSEQLSLAYAKPIYCIMILFTPLIFIIENFSCTLLKLFHINPADKDIHITEGELRVLVDVSHEDGVIETEEKKIINNLFDFGDTDAKDIMVPRIDVCSADINSTYDEIMEVFKAGQYTRIPIYENTTDNIVGILNVKDILLNPPADNFKVSNYMREPLFTYLHKNLSELLMDMKKAATNASIVLDEYGVAVGLVTMEDILEEIVGEIRDEYDAAEENLIKRVSENEYTAEAQMKLDDINDFIGTSFDSEDYDSLGGLIMGELDRLPKVGDSVEINKCTLTVLSVSKNRIDTVHIVIHKENN